MNSLQVDFAAHVPRTAVHLRLEVTLCGKVYFSGLSVSELFPQPFIAKSGSLKGNLTSKTFDEIMELGQLKDTGSITQDQIATFGLPLPTEWASSCPSSGKT